MSSLGSDLEGASASEGPVLSALAAPGRPRRPAAWGAWLVRVLSVAAGLIAWELYAPHVSPILLRPPSAVVRAFGAMVADGTLTKAMGQSLHNLAIGFGIALAVGLVLGVVTARSGVAMNAANPWVSALYSTPSVALVPFLTLWFGIGDAARIAAIAVFSVFPVLINTQEGVRQVDPGLLEVGRSFSSSERRLWTDILLPGALPFILAGTRLGIGRALVGMIVAEFLTSFGGGLGSLIITYQNVFRVDRMLVPVIVVAALGVVLIGFVQWLEGRVAPWSRRDAD